MVTDPEQLCISHLFYFRKILLKAIENNDRLYCYPINIPLFTDIFFLCVCVLTSPKEQKRVDGTTREVKKVRKARNRRQEWNIMAYDKELRPDNRLSPNIYQGASSEGSMSPDTRSVCSSVRSSQQNLCMKLCSFKVLATTETHDWWLVMLAGYKL